MRHVLDNGLTVLLQENHAARVVAFQAWVGAGSADETDAEAGLAHLHEHMLFKGTATRGVGEIARAVESAGGDINAWTSFDETVYHLVMASRDFEAGIDIIADALRHSAFDPDELAREQEVVLEEIKRTYDSPGQRASRTLFGTAFAKHPYRRPVIGFEETVRGFTRDEVLAFYGKHYRPDNVTLVLVGDFETEAALKSIRTAFGDWERGPASDGAPLARVPEPEQRGLRVAIQPDDVKEVYLDLAWHAPAISHADVPAIDVMSVILGQGESSRLVNYLRRRKHVVNDVQGFAYTPKDPGLLMIGAQTPAEKAADALAGMLEVAYRLRHERVLDEELEKAKNLIEADSVYQRETVQGQARKLGFFETVAGSVEFEEGYYRLVRQVTAEDVRRVAEAYLTTDALTVVGLMPEGADLDEAKARALCEAAERHATASVPAARVREPGHIERFTLSSGATLLVQEDRAVPLVAVRGAFVGGIRYEQPDDNGINALMSRMLTSGTARHDAEDIARIVDEWAGSLQGVSGRNSFGLAGEFLSRHFEPGLRLFAECLTEPAYPDDELEKERDIQIEEIRAKEDHPAGIAFELFSQTLWQAHPYRLDVRGTEEALRKLTADDLRAYHQQHYPVERLHLSIVGDIDPERARDLAEELFGAASVESTGAELPKVAPEPPPEAPRSTERRLQKAQAHVVLGYPGASLTDPDRYALDVLSTVLSGQGGRLFVELRDRKSLAYAVTSYILEGLDPGFVSVYIGCSPEKVDEAVAGIREELRKVREEPITEEELGRARRYLVGAHEVGLQRASSRAAVIAFDDAYGVGYETHKQYAENIERVTRDDVLAVAQRYLVPDREVLSIVRP